LGLKYFIAYDVPFYDTDLTKQMTLPAVLRVAVQCSEEQSRNLGRDDDYLKGMGLTWIITHYEIKVTRLPKVNEKILIATEAIAYNKYFCYRDFLFYSQHEQELVRIVATFAVMNLQTRKLQMISEKVVEPFQTEKIKKIRRASKIAEPSLEGLQSVQYRVRFLDLDGNRHVNNSHYLEWFLDPLGIDFLEEYTVKKASLRYVKEVAYGNLIESVFNFSKNFSAFEVVTHHQICVTENLHAEAEVYWNKKKILEE